MTYFRLYSSFLLDFCNRVIAHHKFCIASCQCFRVTALLCFIEWRLEPDAALLLE